MCIVILDILTSLGINMPICCYKSKVYSYVLRHENVSLCLIQYTLRWLMFWVEVAGVNSVNLCMLCNPLPKVPAG
jgi:hypothetical protein